MQIEERIGARVREARQRKGWSQRLLGEQITKYRGQPWLKQTVSAAERGDRDFGAEDMVVLSLVLNQPIAWFYEPNLAATEEIKLRSGYWINEKEMRRVYGTRRSEVPGLADELRQIAQRIETLGEE